MQPTVVEHLLSFFGVVPEPPPKLEVPPAEEMIAKSKASAEALYPESYNGSYTAVVQEENAIQAEDTRLAVADWKEEIQANDQHYLEHARSNRRAVIVGKSNAELAKEEVARARQIEAEMIKKESERLHAMAKSSRDNDQRIKNERAAQSFDNRYLTIEEMVATLQEFRSAPEGGDEWGGEGRGGRGGIK